MWGPHVPPCKLWEHWFWCQEEEMRHARPWEQESKLHLHMELDTTLQLKKDKEKLASCSWHEEGFTICCQGQRWHKERFAIHYENPPTHTGRGAHTQTHWLSEEKGKWRRLHIPTNPCGYHIAFKVYANGIEYGHTRVSVCSYIGRSIMMLRWSGHARIILLLRCSTNLKTKTIIAG